ncbi:MAG: hypothetical protein Q7J56_03515 [Deltaproteobacteria bacterium]|nr:hypothetical protein [Deltaproteobacteria bacterium]
MEKPILSPELADMVEFVKKNSRIMAQTVDELAPAVFWKGSMALIMNADGNASLFDAVRNILREKNPDFFVLVHEAWSASPDVIDRYRKQISPDLNSGTIPLDDRTEQIVVVFSERESLIYMTCAKITREKGKRVIGKFEEVGLLAGRNRDTGEIVHMRMEWPER